MQVWPWQEAVYDRLATGLPNNQFFIEGTPENTEIARLSNGMIRPFASIWFGQTTDAGIGTASMMGVRSSSRRALFLVQMVAPTGRSLLQFEDGIRNLLVGFRPDGQGELKEDSAPTIRDPQPEGTGVDVRFYKPLAYSGLVNSRTSCPV